MTRDRLLAAGREIVAAQGMAGLRTEEVVQRAGTAKGTFFAHFADRDLFLAILLAERVTNDLGGLDPPDNRERLIAVLDKLFVAFAEDAETVVSWHGSVARRGRGWGWTG